MYCWSSVSQADTMFFEFATEMISSTVLIVQGALTLSSHLFIMSSSPQIDSSLHFLLLFDIKAMLVTCSLSSHRTAYTLAM
jgi:hypothetical protein